MKPEENIITTDRLEAFSDGVIAILITIMVLELGFEASVDSRNFHSQFLHLLPKLVSYAVSFIMLGIMWVNHHHLFHSVGRVTTELLWSNLFLLFWMSLIPFVTGMVGNDPLLWQASLFYGVTFALCVVGFTLIRFQIGKHGLARQAHLQHANTIVSRKNMVALTLYLVGALVAYLSVHVALVLFVIVPCMYLMPEQKSQTK